jgi:RNA polymerase-binding protein DksA
MNSESLARRISARREIANTTGGVPMDKEFTEAMRVSLTTMKQEILDKLLAANQDFKAIVEEMDPKDFVDVASDDVDRKMLEALGSQDVKRLRSIEAAIVRIQQGRYGTCVKCSKRIPQERLEALPYAVMCIDCQKSEERRNR